MSVWHAASDHFHELISFNELHHELQNTSVTDIVSNYEPLVVPWEMYCSKKLSCIYIYIWIVPAKSANHMGILQCFRKPVGPVALRTSTREAGK